MMGRSSCPPKFMIRCASHCGMTNGSYHVIVDISSIRQYSEVCWGRIQILQGRLSVRGFDASFAQPVLKYLPPPLPIVDIMTCNGRLFVYWGFR